MQAFDDDAMAKRESLGGTTTSNMSAAQWKVTSQNGNKHILTEDLCMRRLSVEFVSKVLVEQ